jgi:hypothetical protein
MDTINGPNKETPEDDENFDLQVEENGEIFSMNVGKLADEMFLN